MKKWIVLLLVVATLACGRGGDGVQLDSKSDGAPQATVVLEVRK